MNHVCPKCQSDQIQTLRMAYDAGTSTTVHNTTGVGVGVGSGGSLGLGIGGARTTSSSMSALAEKVAPPSPKPITWVVYLLAFGGLLGIVVIPEWDMKATGVGLSALGFFMLYKLKKWNKEEHPKLMAQWENSWICHRCGNTFVGQ